MQTTKLNFIDVSLDLSTPINSMSKTKWATSTLWDPGFLHVPCAEGHYHSNLVCFIHFKVSEIYVRSVCPTQLLMSYFGETANNNSLTSVCFSLTCSVARFGVSFCTLFNVLSFFFLSGSSSMISAMWSEVCLSAEI